jgi:hypothetical protein
MEAAFLFKGKHALDEVIRLAALEPLAKFALGQAPEQVHLDQFLGVVGEHRLGLRQHRVELFAALLDALEEGQDLGQHVPQVLGLLLKPQVFEVLEQPLLLLEHFSG